MTTNRHTKSPQGANLGAFLFPYCRQGLTPRLVAVVSLIEPFADAVGDYTSQDGENKCGHRHSTHPLPLPCVGAATHPVYHSSEHSAIRSNRLESDTVKPVDFDGVKSVRKIKVTDKHLYPINISPTLLFSRFMCIYLTYFVK